MAQFTLILNCVLYNLRSDELHLKHVNTKIDKMKGKKSLFFCENAYLSMVALNHHRKQCTICTDKCQSDAVFWLHHSFNSETIIVLTSLEIT